MKIWWGMVNSKNIRRNINQIIYYCSFLLLFRRDFKVMTLHIIMIFFLMASNLREVAIYKLMAT